MPPISLSIDEEDSKYELENEVIRAHFVELYTNFK